jgi:hypothetical protein
VPAIVIGERLVISRRGGKQGKDRVLLEFCLWLARRVGAAHSLRQPFQ